MLGKLIGRWRRAAAESTAAPAPPAGTPASFDGAHSRRFWTEREAGNPAYVEAYWQGRTHPLRAAVAAAVTALEARSALEVGCHCGPNLWAIGQRRRYDALAGTELSPFVAAAGRRLLAESLDQPAGIAVAAADRLPFADGRFDLVLSCGVLLCIGPEAIERSLRELLRVARRWLVLAEPFDDSPAAASWTGRVDRYPNTAYWIRDYAALLPRLEPVRRVSLARLPPDQRLGHIDSIGVFAKGGSAVPGRRET
jgi:SAM-dependent methyltransferase